MAKIGNNRVILTKISVSKQETYEKCAIVPITAPS